MTLPRIRTKAATAAGILDLMADGRERTVDDVARRLGSTPEKTQPHLTALVKTRALRSEHVNYDSKRYTIYRANRQEAAE